MINHILNKCSSISPKGLREMRMEFARQNVAFRDYAKPFLVSSILIGPLLAEIPYGILHKYYFYLIDIINRIRTLCMFRVREKWEHGQEMQQLIENALNALEDNNQGEFAIQVERAIRRNIELLTSDFHDRTAYPRLGD